MGIDRTSAWRWSRALVFGLVVGLLSGLSAFGVVLLPLSFFASVTEPSAGTQRPLFRTGARIAVWLGVVVALGAAGAAGRWRFRTGRDEQVPEA